VKLELTLPERPGLLHAVPLFNLFALLLMFFVLGPSMVLQSGVSVELPPSRFQMDRFSDARVVTLGAGTPARIHLGREETTLEGLGRLLDENRDGKSGAVLLRTDVGTPVGAEREVAELILKKGFRLMMVGRPVQAGEAPSGKEEDAR
jgi:biopolymer transport protein ExbD